MFGIGAWELFIIFAIILLLFGAKRLPGVATGLGQAINNFRQALKGGDEGENKVLLSENKDSHNHQSCGHNHHSNHVK